MISPALTLGQEVGRCYCRSGKFAKNGVIDWTDLGEWQNPISEGKQENTMNLTEATLVSHDYAVFDCSYLLSYTTVWLVIVLTPKCSRYAILEYLILCMFRRPTYWRCANTSSHDQYQRSSYVSYAQCLILLTGGTQNIWYQSRWQMQWVFRNHLIPIE
jgi:hypothetical protein